MSYLFLIDNPNTEIFLSDKYSVVRIILDWRRGWDSNPRYIAVYLISSQGRYDHFDTSPKCRRGACNYYPHYRSEVYYTLSEKKNQGFLAWFCKKSKIFADCGFGYDAEVR